MVSGGEEARKALEKLLPEPLSDRQWRLLASHGYEQEITSGSRRAEEVADELKDLMDAAKEETSADTQDSDARSAETLTWDEMEQLVLGRTLVEDEDRVAEKASESTEKRSALDPRGWRRIEPRWWVLGGVGLAAVIAAVVVTAVLQWGDDGDGTQADSRNGVAGAVTATEAAGSLDSPLTAESSDAPAATVTTDAEYGISLTTEVPVISGLAESARYVADLSGSQAVPSVDTEASGSVVLRVISDGRTIEYVFSVYDLEGLLVARMCTGEPGKSGKEIVTLCDLGPAWIGTFSGVVVEDSFSADDFVGPLKGKTIEDLIELIKDGLVYVYVGTEGHPTGEIRGHF